MRLVRAITRQAKRLRRRARFRRLARVDLARCRELSESYDIAGGYRRIYFHHIRKTAGTSLNRAFVGLCSDDPGGVYDAISETGLLRVILGDKVFVGWNQALITEGYFYYAWSHDSVRRLRLPEKTFRITCFRDPVKRVISHYRMLLDWRERGSTDPDNRQVAWLGDSFEDFLDRIPAKQLLRQLYMFSPALVHAEAFDRVAGLEFVLHTEAFGDGLAALGKRLGVNLVEHRANRSASRAELPYASVERLRDMLEPEYRLLLDLRRAGVGVHPAARPAEGEGEETA